MQFRTGAIGISGPQRAHVHLVGVVRIQRHRLVTDNRLIVLEVSNTEITQQCGAFKAGAFVQRDHLRTVAHLRQMSGIGDHHRRTGVTFRANLCEEHILEIATVNAFNKQYRAAIGGLLELPLRQCGHTGVGFRFGQHFILMF